MINNIELALNDTHTKALIKQAILELLKEKRSEFYEMIIEAIEEIGLANAIYEGKSDDFVSEKQIEDIISEKI